MSKKYDVGILGWWYGQNYGSMLTYYALNKVVRNLGYSPIMVHEALGYNGWRVKWSKDIEPMNFARRQGYEFTKQQHFSENSKLNELADTFMVGSDQLWNPNVGRVNDDLFLDFTNDNAKRIAYATSFGNADVKKFKPEFIGKHGQNLKRFDAVSVRENYGLDIAKNVFDVEEVEQVLDPVFLLNKDEYSRLAKGATTRPEGDYLVSFILDPTPEKKAVITNIAKKLEILKIVVLTDADKKSTEKAQDLFSESKFQVISDVKPENWLYAYKNSKYVITDSFHGSCFSFIFQKPFSVFFNVKRGADRFANLMKLFELSDERRIYENYSEEDVNRNEKISYEIDYLNGNNKVAAESKRSFEWLRKALYDPKKTEKILPAAKENLTQVARDETNEKLLKELGFQPLQYASSTLYFEFDSEAWEEHFIKGITTLMVKNGYSKVGVRAMLPLSYSLKEDQHYRLEIRFKIKTQSPLINFHIYDSMNQKQVVLSCKLSGGESYQEYSEIFTPNSVNYNSFMIGAVHINGEGNYLALDYICITEV